MDFDVFDSVWCHNVTAVNTDKTYRPQYDIFDIYPSSLVLFLFINQKIGKIHVVNHSAFWNVNIQEQNRKNVIKIHIDSNRFSIQMPIRISSQSVSRCCSLLWVFCLVNLATLMMITIASRNVLIVILLYTSLIK